MHHAPRTACTEARNAAQTLLRILVLCFMQHLMQAAAPSRPESCKELDSCSASRLHGTGTRWRAYGGFHDL